MTDTQYAAVPAEVLASLNGIRSVLSLLNQAVIVNEAVHGYRLIEPRNDLSQQLKEINWCIARLSGSTELADPPRGELTALPGEQRRTGIDPDYHPA